VKYSIFGSYAVERRIISYFSVLSIMSSYTATRGWLDLRNVNDKIVYDVYLSQSKNKSAKPNDWVTKECSLDSYVQFVFVFHPILLRIKLAFLLQYFRTTLM